MLEFSYCCSLNGRRWNDGARERELVRIWFARTNHGERDRAAGLAFKHEADHGQRELAGGAVADGFDHVAVAEVLAICRRAGNDADDGCIAVAFGNGDADLGHTIGGPILVDLVFGRSEIAGVGVKRLEQAVQGAVGHLC